MSNGLWSIGGQAMAVAGLAALAACGTRQSDFAYEPPVSEVPAFVADAAEVSGTPARPTTQPFTVLVWNLEHFVDPFDDPYISNPREDLPQTKDPEVLALLAEVIREADPDILALQEVEGDRAIKYFLDNFLPDHNYQYFSSLPSISWYQNTAVASRFPLGRTVSFREVEMYNSVSDETTNLYNNRLSAVVVQPNPDYQFLLTNLHLKAGRGAEDVTWRLRQIDILKKYFAEQMACAPEANILVVGDMNFLRDSEEYNAMAELEPPLVDAFEPVGGALTHASGSPSRQLDYIFFNEPMGREQLPDSATVLRPLSLEEMATISDHLPVFAAFYPEDL